MEKKAEESMELQKALQEIRTKSLQPIYLVTGTEKFLQEQVRQAFLTRFEVSKDDLNFASFDMEFVDKYLFAIMCLYLFVNFFYEKRNPINKKFWKENIIQIILLIIMNLIPFIYYNNTGNLNFTYKIMLLYLFFEYIIILIVSYISKPIKKLFKKNDSPK